MARSWEKQDLTSLFFSSSESSSCLLRVSSSIKICQDQHLVRHGWIHMWSIVNLTQFHALSSLASASFHQQPVLFIELLSMLFSWSVSCLLACSSFKLALLYSVRSCLVAFSLSSHRATLTPGVSASDSLAAFDSCLASFFPFLCKKIIIIK